MFKQIPGYPDYRVNKSGSVQSRKVPGSRFGKTGPWRPMKPLAYKGYWTVSLWLNGRSRRWGIHQLVALAFLGPRPQGMEVCHWDGDRKNNRLSNLRYGTRAENTADAIRHGNLAIGERNYNAKLTNAQVKEIRKLAADGVLHRVIGERFGVGRHYIAKIVCREIWKHVT